MKKLYSVAFWKKHKKLVHGFSTKTLGNLSIRTGDQTIVLQKRGDLAEELGVDKKHILFMPLSHSNRVLSLPKSSPLLKSDTGVYVSGGNLFPVINPAHSNPEWQAGIDAVVTDMKNVFPTILSADCAAVGLFDKQKSVCALAHAGLIGAVNQILTSTVRCMVQEYHSNPKDIEVVIFPSIRKCHYDLKLSGAWNRIKDDVGVYYGTSASFFANNRFDLQSLLTQQLLSEGVLAENIYDTNLCTVCEHKMFFSNLAAGTPEAKKIEGRFASTIGMKDES